MNWMENPGPVEADPSFDLDAHPINKDAIQTKKNLFGMTSLNLSE